MSAGNASVSPRAKLVLAFAALYIVWGTTYLAIKAGLDAGLPAALFAGVRLVPAGIIMLGIALWRGASLRVTRRDLITVSVVGILLLVGGQYGTFLAEQRIPSGLASLIVAIVPLWIALAESALPDMQRPSRLGWLGLVVGFTGLGILLFPHLTGLGAGMAEAIGVGTQLCATWLWTAGSIYSKRTPLKMDAVASTGFQMLIAGVVLVGIGTVKGEWPQFHLTAQGFWSIVYLSLVGSCVAFLAFVYALKHAPASKVMTYAYVNPVIAVFAGWLAGKAGLVPAEPLTVWTLGGLAVIVAGVALTTSAPTLPARSREPAAEAAGAKAEVEASPNEA